MRIFIFKQTYTYIFLPKAYTRKLTKVALESSIEYLISQSHIPVSECVTVEVHQMYQKARVLENDLLRHFRKNKRSLN